MSLGPILPGRIPNSLVGSRLSQAMASTQRNLTQLQEQLSSGQRYFVPSEDPSAASRTILLQMLQERKTQFERNVETDSSFLSSTDTTLASVADVLSRAKTLLTSGIGDSVSPTERIALADEAGALVRQVINTGNTTFRGRFLFGGSQAGSPPYELVSQNAVRYSGDTRSIESLIDLSTSITSNVTGDRALGGLSSTASRDVNPALTLSTTLRDLHGGQGVTPGSIVVSLSSGPQSATIDLRDADNIADVKARIEAAFTPGAVTVSINAGQNGLQIAAASGTVAVANAPGSALAYDLGILAGPAASIAGADLDPAVSLTTTLASLNGGSGIGATAGNGLQIVNGDTTSTIDLAGLVTVEDLFNTVRLADPDLNAGINASRNGLEIVTRLSGVDFSIGENNGTNATLLGIRTLVGSTTLASLNHGTGVPLSASDPLQITRRDGTSTSVDLTGAVTLQDAVNLINAADPGNLVASLNTVGNGLQLVDNSGTGPLSVDANPVGRALGLAGTETGTNPAVPLVGSDPNPQEVSGTLNLLIRLRNALEQGDNAELNRLGPLFEAEISNVTQIRGEVGGRIRVLEDATNRLGDEKQEIIEALSDNFDTDFAVVLTQLVNQQTLYSAILQTSADTLRMGLLNYL